MTPPQDRPPWRRREFLATTALAAGSLHLAATSQPAIAFDDPPQPEPKRFPLIGFTKPFQDLGPEETADLVAAVGWDGIECPVRARGQIEPERVADDLPRFAEALRRQQRDIHLVTTDLTSLKSPHADTILRTLAQLGIRRFRLGFFHYPANIPPPDRLKEIAPALGDIADACRELGLQAGFQNHSGAHYVGAPVWDVFSMIQPLDPRHIGFCFDIGHATVEGGLSWPIEARLAEPFFTAVIVKDYYWKKEAAGWKDTWCPLGEGMVNRAFFDWLKQTAYQGPICQHHEYDLGDAQQQLASMQHDLKVLKEWLA